MKLAMQIGYSGGFEASVAQVQALEKAGMDIAYVAEAYGYDGVSLMGYLAQDRIRPDRGGHSSHLHAHPDAFGHDGGRG